MWRMKLQIFDKKYIICMQYGNITVINNCMQYNTIKMIWNVCKYLKFYYY